MIDQWGRNLEHVTFLHTIPLQTVTAPLCDLAVDIMAAYFQETLDL